jgi:hypothetical protein
VSEQAVDYNIEAEVKDLKPQIDKLIPPIGGVLVVVRKKQNQYGTWFDLAWIGGAGRDPGAVFDEYRHTPILVRILPLPWVASFEFYWVTPRADRSAINTSA